ncbi:TolC family protein [Ruficoccus amylovorans]|uniref:TolC family protein n=1 Tax=Ruficoccus amylovorans TaxID=1804625 RepID=A0A842HBA8_9BACT|nr:TolC family protein [Ruficoccus amylovorans]MBC2593429.1 TolC family protein [Ruficoccus amylovorans]
MKLSFLFSFLTAVLALPLAAQTSPAQGGAESAGSAANAPSGPAGKSAPAPAQTYTVAVVRDGDSPVFETQLAGVRQELEGLLRGRVQVVFKEDGDFSAHWAPGRAAEALRAGLVDPEADAVLVQGLLVMNAATGATYPLPKPVVGAWLQEPEMINLLLDEMGRSKVPNLNLVTGGHTVREDLQDFIGLVDFSRLYVLVDAPYADATAFMQDYLDELKTAVKAQVEVVGMGADAQSVLDQLPPDARAVYLFPPWQMDKAEREKLIAGINARGLPSFAFRGEPAVRAGVLAGSLPDIDLQLTRRLALNLQRIILGSAPETLAARIRVEPRLYLNALTAQQIGYDIGFETAANAEVLFEDEIVTGDPIELVGAIEKALRFNFEYLSRQQDTKVSYEDKRLAMSPLLPQISAFTGYQQVDAGTVRASGGATPKVEANVGVRISQIIYSDQRLANLQVAGENYQAATLQEEVTRLDIIQGTAFAYINYLSALAVERVARDNLAVTRRNLELSRIREEVGTGGREEVYRFEAAEAGDRAQVSDAQATVEQALVALNQVLGEDLSKRWQPEDLSLESSHFRDVAETASGLIATASDYERFRLFSLQYGVSRSPEVGAFDRLIQGQEISLDQKQRAFYMPEVGANFNYANTFHQSSEYNPTFPPDDDAWAVMVEAEIPIFEGGARVFDVIRQRSVVRGLEYTRELTRQLVQQRILNALYSLAASRANIEYSKTAADRANRNLDIVTDKYRQGMVNNIDLIDAQNEAFTQRQNEVLAVYGFLQDMVNYMRAINFYEFYADPAQRTEWIQRAQAFIGREATRSSAVSPQ